MTFIEFKKMLLDVEITLPKFCKLIKVSDKNIQSYKKKEFHQQLMKDRNSNHKHFKRS